MIIFKKIKDLQRYFKSINAPQLKIGFTPTMGALHDGHLSLILASKVQSTLTVCSIFVNPTQFNQVADLSAYPITTDKDIYLLEKVGCDVLFLPDVNEIYPTNMDTQINIDLNGLGDVLEGAKRPGHFAGVLQVVKRLLDIIQPDEMYMGEKDFQQLAVIRQMVKVLNISTKVIGCPIKREESGLAMSSRNVRLSLTERENAIEISKVLLFLQNNINQISIVELKKQALSMLEKVGLKPEYVEIVTSQTLQVVNEMDSTKETRALIAAWTGNVRLIDNCNIPLD